MSEGDLVARKRLESLYRTLLTPVALIVTVSGVSYVNAAIIFGIHGILEFYVVTMGMAVIFLTMSALAYSAGHLDVKKYRRDTYRAAFGLLVVSPFLSSSLLVAQSVTIILGGASNSSVTFIAFSAYLTIGIISATWFVGLASKD